MKKEHFVLLCVPLSALLLLFAGACSMTGTGTQSGDLAPAINKARAEAVLEQYLNARAEGQHEKCLKFLTTDLLKRFDEIYGVDYVVFHRTDEIIFKDPKILSLRERGDGTIVAEVSVVVEGEGYKQDALEEYYMVRETGSWKIEEWKIEYSEEVDEWPYEDQ